MTEAERNIIVGNRIKEARTLRNMTLDEVADTVKVAKSTIQRYETAKIQSLKMPVLESIANALSVNPVWLMGEDVDMERYHQVNIGEAIGDEKLDQIFRNSKTPKPTSEYEMMEDEIELVETYRTLDDYGKKTVKAVLESESERCQEQEEYSIPMSDEELKKLPLDQVLKLEPYIDNGMLRVARKRNK